MQKTNQITDNFKAEFSPLKGVFKKVDFFSFDFNCQRCKQLNTKTIPSDVPTDVACSKCGKVHIAYPESFLKNYVKQNNN